MSRIEEPADDFDAVSTESTLKLVLTLIVTTVIAFMAVYVLSAPLFGAGTNGPGHRAALATIHSQT